MAKIEMDITCQSCKGTGLYSGMGESKNCAVVCWKCKGTGKYRYVFEYEPFVERVLRNDIERVFARTCGIKHGAEDYQQKNGDLIEFSKGGASYEDWLNGTEPLPMKALYCPKIWTSQKWNSEKCEKHCHAGMLIHRCPMHSEMDECWKEYELSLK